MDKNDEYFVKVILKLITFLIVIFVLIIAIGVTNVILNNKNEYIINNIKSNKNIETTVDKFNNMVKELDNQHISVEHDKMVEKLKTLSAD